MKRASEALHEIAVVERSQFSLIKYDLITLVGTRSENVAEMIFSISQHTALKWASTLLKSAHPPALGREAASCSCHASFIPFLGRASARRTREASVYTELVGVSGLFTALKPLGRSAFQALLVAFQPRAAPRGLVAALGRSGLELVGRPSQCGPYREPCRAWQRFVFSEI